MRLVAGIGLLATTLIPTCLAAVPASYDEVWTTQSLNSSGSMPVGGGDIGLNAWAENGTILFYIAKSGTFDENNSMLKLGRVRLTMNPNPFAANASSFEQRLIVNDGYIKFSGTGNTTVNIWVDVFNPVIHVEVASNLNISLTAAYENWRFADRTMVPGEQAQSSWGNGNNANFGSKNYPLPIPVTKADNTSFLDGGVLSFHRNSGTPLWDFQTKAENMQSNASTLFNPMTDNTFGVFMHSPDLQQGNISSGVYVDTEFRSWTLKSPVPKKAFNISIALAQNQTSTLQAWQDIISSTHTNAANNDQTASLNWWHSYWNRSSIIINEDAGASDPGFQVGKNYQLFRYMMGCNAFGAWPTKFNGGIFTFDPVFVSKGAHFTPDYRRWGGGTFTAQNQRLLYWPLLKSGDFDIMTQQFDFYKRITPALIARGQNYFGINAAFSNEQIDNTGLSNLWNYGANLYESVQPSKPSQFPIGVDFSSYVDFVQDTANEFVDMILQANIYTGLNVTQYMPFIENQIRWFDLFYQSKLQSNDVFPKTGGSGNQKLVIYPGSGCETYKAAYNPASTISGLRKVLTDLLEVNPTYSVGSKSYYTTYLASIPATPLRLQQGYQCIAPAVAYNRIQNQEIPQLYPLFPWGEYGIGLPDLEIAQNTWNYDTETQGWRTLNQEVGWRQDQIWLARMGYTANATTVIQSRLANSPQFRFSAFRGPNFDWAPDINHFGSSAIGLQEQLIQTFVNRTIRILPTTPTTWSGSFKLYAPYDTIVEVDYLNGNVTNVVVTPQSRMADVVYYQN